MDVAMHVLQVGTGCIFSYYRGVTSNNQILFKAYKSIKVSLIYY